MVWTVKTVFKFRVLPPLYPRADKVWVELRAANQGAVWTEVPLKFSGAFSGLCDQGEMVGEAELEHDGQVEMRVLGALGGEVLRECMVPEQGQVRAARRCRPRGAECTVELCVNGWAGRANGTFRVMEVARMDGEGKGVLNPVVVWLPPDYEKPDGQSRKYPVIYLEEGCEAFFSQPVREEELTPGWCHREEPGLAVHQWILRLNEEGAMPLCAAVALCPGGECTAWWRAIHEEVGGSVSGAEEQRGAEAERLNLSLEHEGEDWARFAADEVVPMLESMYRFESRTDSRVIGGTGLGALHALYLVWTRPEVFGRAFCLGTAFEDVSCSPPSRAAWLIEMERRRAPDDVKVYFDYGERGIEECYEPYHRILEQALKIKGLLPGADFVVTRVAGGEPSRMSWRWRIGDALRWVWGAPHKGAGGQHSVRDENFSGIAGGVSSAQ